MHWQLRDGAMKPGTLLAGLLLGASLPLQAATFVVNDVGDDPDGNPGDGICPVYSDRFEATL
jgi:hypothetical protein